MTGRCRHDMVPEWCGCCRGVRPRRPVSASVVVKATPPRIDPFESRSKFVQAWDGSPLSGPCQLPHGLAEGEVNHWYELARKADNPTLLCEVCMRTFTARRRDAVCCSARCRKQLQRAKASIESLPRDSDWRAVAESEEGRLWGVATRLRADPGSNDWDHMLSLDELNGNSHRPPPWADRCICESCQLTPAGAGYPDEPLARRRVSTVYYDREADNADQSGTILD